MDRREPQLERICELPTSMTKKEYQLTKDWKEIPIATHAQNNIFCTNTQQPDLRYWNLG